MAADLSARKKGKFWCFVHRRYINFLDAVFCAAANWRWRFYTASFEQKILWEGMNWYDDFFYTLETVIGWCTGHDGSPSDCNMVAPLWVGGYEIDNPLRKIVEGHFFP
jgi:hypothetical protein